LNRLARFGRRGADLATAIDLTTSLGPRHTARLLEQRKRFVRSRPAGVIPTNHALWKAAAEKLGADFVDGGSGFGLVRRGTASTWVWNHWVALDDIVTARRALDKVQVHEAMRALRFPVPHYLEFDGRKESRAAVDFLENCGAPCVVKPVAGSFGGGATASITSEDQLYRAINFALRISSRLLIEMQHPGAVYRFLVMEGEVIDVLKRWGPTVVGDGHSSIGDLIIEENERRLSEESTPFSNVSPDFDCLFTLAAQGLSIGSVPSAGTSVVVKTVTSQNGQADNESVRGRVAKRLEDDAVRAAEAIGLRFAGVDLMTADDTRGLEDEGVILEVNGTPGLLYHSRIRNREDEVPVAEIVLARLLEEGQ
jgi:D-alanine-D-alanine ligase-like ATP-grasp enzyme